MLEPSLLQEGSVTDLIPALATLILGMLAISSGLAGYLVGRARTAERIALVGSGFLMVYPDILVSALGMVVAAAVVVIQVVRRRRDRSEELTAETA